MDKRPTRGGQWLRGWMRENSRIQVGLAAELGTTQPNVSAWLTGRMRMPLEMAIRIRDLTGIPVDAWTEEADDADQSGEHSALPVAGTG